MTARASIVLRVGGLAIVILTAAACGRPEEPLPRPELTTDFNELFNENCVGCHGIDGRHGVAQPLNDAVYLAVASDARLREVVARGVPGTPMTAFGRASGGTLTNEQVDALVGGMKRRWGSGPEMDGVSLPAYSEAEALARGVSPGESDRGRRAYVIYCARCHGADGRGGPSAGSVVDGAFLALTSDQSLRTSIIAGRAADRTHGWRDYVPGQPMKEQEISDVVKWLSAQRGNHD